MVTQQRREVVTKRGVEILGRLFPVSPAPRVTLGNAFLVFSALVLGTLVSIARQTGVGALATLYAEDGRVFLGGALSHHQGLGALSESYMGYIHTLPRVLGALAVSLPLRWAAVVLSGGAAAVVTALALLVFRASAGHLRSTIGRMLLAGSLIFLPVATAEVLDNVANLHWFMMFAAFWVLLWRTDRGWEIAVGSALLFLTGASDPLTSLLAPVVIVRLLTLRGVRNHVFTVAWSGGLLVQAMGILLGHAHRSLFPSIQLAKVAGWYVFDVLDRAVFGTQLLGSARSLQGVGRAAAGILVLGALAVVGIRAGLLRDRPLTVLAIAMSVVYFVVPVVLTGISAPRYSVVPILLVFTAVACVLDTSLRRVGPRSLMGTRIAAIALLGIVRAVEFPVNNARSTSVQWVDQLVLAQAACTQSPFRNVAIPIAPPGWEVDASCRDVTSR